MFDDDGEEEAYLRGAAVSDAGMGVGQSSLVELKP